MSKSDELHRTLGANIDESMGSTRRTASPVAPRTLPPRLQGLKRVNNAADIDLDRIVADPDQPRTQFDEDALRELAESIKTRGQLQPIRVRWSEGQGAYIVVVGERRWRAARMAGLATLSCMIIEGQPSPEELLEDQLIENCIRVDLKPIEQARAFDRLMKARGLSQRDLAERLNVSPASVARAVRLLDLPEEIQESVDEGRLPAASGYQIAQVEDAQAQRELAQLAAAEGLTTSEVAEAVKAVRARRPVAAIRPQPVEVDLGDGTVVVVKWKKANATTALQAARRVVKILQERERQGEVDAA